MRFRLYVCALLAGAAAGVGCSKITIDNPKNGATNVVMPLDVQITKSGNVSMGDVLLDSFNMTQVNGGNLSVVPGRFYYMPTGQHTLFVGATNSKTHQNISESSTFTVSSCPLCYTCPTGMTVHPSLGQCCDNGQCDWHAFSNFGTGHYSQTYCNKATFPGSTKYWSDFDCIGTAVDQIRGANPPQMIAVSFSPGRAGELRHIRAPIGLQSGTNGVRVWITADLAGRPGQILETITVQIRPQPGATTVASPEHIFSTTRPTLTVGTTYWLIIGPAAADTVVAWNQSLGDVSIPNTITLLMNASTNVSGPWAPKNPAHLAHLRPAFEIDVR